VVNVNFGFIPFAFSDLHVGENFGKLTSFSDVEMENSWLELDDDDDFSYPDMDLVEDDGLSDHSLE